jgi:hypothetical protein
LVLWPETQGPTERRGKLPDSPRNSSRRLVFVFALAKTLGLDAKLESDFIDSAPICGAAKIRKRGLAMGRGRQKAKHTKVARELKYFSPSTDYSALEKELTKAPGSNEPEYEDKWSDLYEDEEVEEDQTPKS